MKIKSLFLSILLVVLLVGCSLINETTKSTTSSKTTTTTTIQTTTTTTTQTTTTTAIELVEIYVQNTDELYCNVGEVFKTSKLNIIARYSDGEEISVSEHALFDPIATHTPGSRALTIYYKDKSVTVMVDVLQPISLQIETSKVKTQYEIGNTLDITNLGVYYLYENNQKKVCPSYTVKITNPANTLIPINSVFTSKGVYKVSIESNGLSQQYDITVGDIDETPGATLLFTVELLYSGISGYEPVIAKVYSNSTPSDFVRVFEGYTFMSFSLPFEQWKQDDQIKLYYQKTPNTKIVYLVNDDLTTVTHKIYDANTTVYKADFDTVVPTIIPEGKKFVYWNMPTSFVISDDVFIYPVFVPISFNMANLTEEQTVSNISANAVDVNTEEFVKATPEGYSLDSITIGLNGEILREIPYEEGLESAYFTDLENNTEYEIGAYYSENESSTYNLRSTRALTYRFHFVGFMIVTQGDVLHRVRMMYNGECLYRWYYAEDSYVSNYHFFYDFQLPIEYEDYECVGCEEVVGYITQNIDLEVVLVKKGEQTTFTVVFYKGLSYGNLTILKTETVNKGGSATPPIVEPFEDGKYRYIFDYWNGNYQNVTQNEKVYAEYIMEPLYPVLVEMNMIIGDTYLYIFGFTDNQEIWPLCHYNLYDVTNNQTVEQGLTEVDYNNKHCVSTKLIPGNKYEIRFDYTDQRMLPLNVVTNYRYYEFETRLGTEKSGLSFTTTATSYSININEQYSNVEMFINRKVNADGSLSEPSSYVSTTLPHNTKYCMDPVLTTTDAHIYHVYFDNIMVSTLDAVVPNITAAAASVSQGSITVNGVIEDQSNIVSSVTLYYKLTDNSNFITKSCKVETLGSTKQFSLTVNLSVVDPDTGETKYYVVSEAYISVRYTYGGSSYNTLRKDLTLSN